MTTLSFLLMMACALKALPTDTGEDAEAMDINGIEDVDADVDADGYTPADGDCDDLSTEVYPNAPEICDGEDNNCDGTIDEGLTITFYLDTDGDAWGDSDTTLEACELPDGFTELDGDCNDRDPEISPEADERCDGADNDCDGDIDEDLITVWYYDADGDGFGDVDSGYDTCDPPSGWVTDSSDCDDTAADAHPGGTEVCDERDNDCDGTTDEGVTTTFYRDDDSDGFGLTSGTVGACAVIAGYSPTPGDCNDTDGSISPNSTELCDGVDNDCNGTTDESTAADASDWYADTDADGFGDPSSVTTSCVLPSGYVDNNSDCDDTDVDINPSVHEICDGEDNNCNGWLDAGDPTLTDGTTFYADADGDGYGTTDYSTLECAAPTGYVEDSTDCDDTHADSYPGADEVCDGDDNDCDGSADEDAIDMLTFYRDFDSDSYGDASTTTDSCTEPAGYVDNDGDCSDTQPAINPGAAEECNSKDDDCDGLTDDDDTDLTGAPTWYQDYDSDGYGTAAMTAEACSQPIGYVIDSTDCDDYDSTSKPGAVETCDGTDNDCDGLVDDDDSDVTGQHTWYTDCDGDGFGDPTDSTAACTQPTGRIPNHSDCDDTDHLIHPGVDEVCDGVDNNCEGTIDEELLGIEAACAAYTCQEIFEEDTSSIDGLYWIAPNGDVDDAVEAYCDMTRDGGGWTRLYATLYPTWWAPSDWGTHGDAADDDYSILDLREHFSDDDGNWILRLEIGVEDSWDTADYDYLTVWSQGHDPIDGSSDGSDYALIDGDEPSTCDGFTGLHGSYYDEGGSYARSSDADADDDADCWGMQFLPLEQYGDEENYPGYLDSYNDSGLHAWQVLWVR